MKRYIYNGRCYWFDPDKAPDGAVEVKVAAPQNKAAKVEDKAKRTRKKKKKA